MGIDDLQTPVARLVDAAPGAARVFERLGLDYCCGGKLTLAQACQRAGLEPAAVLQQLTASAMDAAEAHPTSWADASFPELITHILDVHHAFLRRELPRLSSLADKVAAVHTGNHPELVELRLVVHQLASELDVHMQKEERILFPMIHELGGPMRARAFHCGTISNPIRVMELEHRDAGHGLERLRALTGGFTAPADGCASYRALMEGLAALELDLHAHVHEENNILFPRAEAREQEAEAANA